MVVGFRHFVFRCEGSRRAVRCEVVQLRGGCWPRWIDEVPCNSSSDPEVTDGVYPYAPGPADGVCQNIVDDGVGYDKKPIVKVVASLLPILLH
jgi:hypothetical protein